MKYSLDLKWKLTTEVEAESRIEAIQKLKELFPNHKAEYIGDDEGNSTTIDYCEGCYKPIFESDEEVSNRFMDEYGNHYCADCGADN